MLHVSLWGGVVVALAAQCEMLSQERRTQLQEDTAGLNKRHCVAAVRRFMRFAVG
jgi:hypothetical protein